jgi:hypothetical protein
MNVVVFHQSGLVKLILNDHRIRKNPMTSLNSVTLERVDQLARMNEPYAPDLKHAVQILNTANKYKIKLQDSDNTTYKEWSVFSDKCSSISDSEDDLTSRLKEVEQGTRLRRKSTMVSDFGFKKEDDKPSTRKISSLETIPEATQKPREARMHLLKFANKHELNPRRDRAEAFFFLNQLGMKLLIKNNERQRKFTNDGESLENHKIKSENNSISSCSIKDPKDPDYYVMMSPIKRRKEIKKPNLNHEQTNILDLWAVYKSGDFLSFSEDSQKKQRNLSQTPIPSQTLINIKNPSNIDDNGAAKSCSKFSVMKAKRKKKKSKKMKSKNSTTKRRDNAGSDLNKNMITISQFKHDKKSSTFKIRPQRPTSDKKVSLYESNNTEIYPKVTEDTVRGLGDILDKLEGEDTKPLKSVLKTRKRSVKYISDIIPISPRKSPKKRKKRKTTKDCPSGHNLSQTSRTITKKSENPFNTLLDLTDIVASLDNILEEGI